MYSSGHIIVGGWRGGKEGHTRTLPIVLYTFRALLTAYSLHSAVFLQKLTSFQPVKKFPAFHGTRRFITAFTSARHLSLS